MEAEGGSIFLKKVMSGLEASSQEKSWWKCEIPYNSAMAAILARATCVSDSIETKSLVASYFIAYYRIWILAGRNERTVVNLMSR
jgi:hypothetical protein